MRIFLAILLVFLMGLAVGGFFLPKVVTVERETLVQRPAATVFALLNGFQSHAQWSSWEALDPEAEFSVSGPRSGVGARLDWVGSPARLGTGWQEVIRSEPLRLIELDVHGGAQGDAQLAYLISGDSLASRVVWRLTTDVTAGKGFFGSWVGRYFGLFLEEWTGEEFELGLASFKRYAEALPAADFSSADISVVTLEPGDVVGVSGEVEADSGQMALELSEAFRDLAAWAVLFGLPLEGQPLAIIRDLPDGMQGYEAAIPLMFPSNPGRPEAKGKVRYSQSPGGLTARLIHRGPYDRTQLSHERLEAYAAAQGYVSTGVRWEHYVSDPATTEAAELITYIYLQLKADPAKPGT